MDIVFATLSDLRYEFQYLMVFWGFIVFLIYILFATRSPRRIFCAAVCTVLYVIALIFSYYYTYAQYMSAHVGAETVELYYKKSKIVIAKKDIRDVILDNKGHKCTIYLKDKVYRSAPISAQECQRIKEELKPQIIKP